MSLIDQIREYVWVPSGEVLRGIEITAGTAAVEFAIGHDISAVTDWKVWAVALGTAVVHAVLAYVKGKLPAPEGDPK